jgi:hypothetical protein
MAIFAVSFLSQLPQASQLLGMTKGRVAFHLRSVARIPGHFLSGCDYR